MNQNKVGPGPITSSNLNATGGECTLNDPQLQQVRFTNETDPTTHPRKLALTPTQEGLVVGCFFYGYVSTHILGWVPFSIFAGHFQRMLAQKCPGL